MMSLLANGRTAFLKLVKGSSPPSIKPKSGTGAGPGRQGNSPKYGGSPMPHEYYYMGNSTALVKINGSEAYVCIDTNSWESLIYAQGYPIEPNEVSVMRRFLAPGDVFLDVGANFGIYSAIASEILAHSGRIFSFEANPHTYKFLKKTAMANRLLFLPQHKFTNIAVGPHDGETQFAYSPEGLGGGHIVFEQENTDALKVVTVKMAALDSLLPKDLEVNFCKIDVEGHELGALQGMSDIIRRSKNIRILIEHYTNSDQVTTAGKAVVDYVRSLGLSICTVEGNGRLKHVPSDQIPTGNVYLLATRTPQQDVDRALGSTTIRPTGLQYHAVFKNSKHPLVQADGTFRYRREEHAETEEPSLFFGPYIGLKAGEYRLRFLGVEASGVAHLTLVCNMGAEPVLSTYIDDWSQPVPFSLSKSVTDFETVLRKADLRSLAFQEIAIERL